MWTPLSNIITKIGVWVAIAFAVVATVYSKIAIERRQARKEVLDEIKKDTASVEKQWKKIDGDKRDVDESLRRLRD